MAAPVFFRLFIFLKGTKAVFPRERLSCGCRMRYHEYTPSSALLAPNLQHRSRFAAVGRSQQQASLFVFDLLLSSYLVVLYLVRYRALHDTSFPDGISPSYEHNAFQQSDAPPALLSSSSSTSALSPKGLSWNGHSKATKCSESIAACLYLVVLCGAFAGRVFHNRGHHRPGSDIPHG